MQFLSLCSEYLAATRFVFQIQILEKAETFSYPAGADPCPRIQTTFNQKFDPGGPESFFATKVHLLPGHFCAGKKPPRIKLICISSFCWIRVHQKEHNIQTRQLEVWGQKRRTECRRTLSLQHSNAPVNLNSSSLLFRFQTRLSIFQCCSESNLFNGFSFLDGGHVHVHSVQMFYQIDSRKTQMSKNCSWKTDCQTGRSICLVPKVMFWKKKALDETEQIRRFFAVRTCGRRGLWWKSLYPVAILVLKS